MTQLNATAFLSLTAAEYDYAMLWLNQAQSDAVEAANSKSKLHAMFWVQQSVEKSVKGLMLLRGKNLYEYSKYRTRVTERRLANYWQHAGRSQGSGYCRFGS